MTKYEMYLRLGKSRKRGSLIGKLSTKPTYEAVTSTTYGSRDRHLPTLLFKVIFEIDDKEFSGAKNLLEIELKKGKPCIEVKQEESDSL